MKTLRRGKTTIIGTIKAKKSISDFGAMLSGCDTVELKWRLQQAALAVPFMGPLDMALRHPDTCSTISLGVPGGCSGISISISRPVKQRAPLNGGGPQPSLGGLNQMRRRGKTSPRSQQTFLPDGLQTGASALSSLQIQAETLSFGAS